MDKAGFAPVAVSEDSAVLTVEDDFASILDVPYVTVNKIDGRCVAEVWLSGDEIYDRLRLSRAYQAAHEHGQQAYAHVHGAYGNVMIYFAEYPNGGA